MCIFLGFRLEEVSKQHRSASQATGIIHFALQNLTDLGLTLPLIFRWVLCPFLAQVPRRSNRVHLRVTQESDFLFIIVFVLDLIFDYLSIYNFNPILFLVLKHDLDFFLM